MRVRQRAQFALADKGVKPLRFWLKRPMRVRTCWLAYMVYGGSARLHVEKPLLRPTYFRYWQTPKRRYVLKPRAHWVNPTRRRPIRAWRNC